MQNQTEHNPSILFDQDRVIMANIRSNYLSIFHENEELRKLIIKLQKENDEFKRNLEKSSQEISESNS